MSTASQSLTASAVKAYQIIKLKAGFAHHHGSAEFQLQNGTIVMDQPYLLYAAEYSMNRAAQRLKSLASAREQRLRVLWRASKARAKQRIRDMLSRHLGVTIPAQPAVPEPLYEPVASSQTQQAAEPLTISALTDSQREEMFGTDGWLRYGVLSGLANLSHFFMHKANTVTVEGSDIMKAALNRPQGQGLITVCNHVAAMDDPLAVSTIIPPEYYQQPKALRWTLCASDRCFKYKALVPFFTAAKVLPVQRGAGLNQPGMAAAEERLAAGDWIHIFPEGTRSRDPSKLGVIRKGVGRLVAAAAAASSEGSPAPLVVPFVHAGMEDIMPVGSSVPKTGQKVQVVVGEPIPVDDLMQQAKQLAWSHDQLYSAIAARIETRMQDLHASVRAAYEQRVRNSSALSHEESSQGPDVLHTPHNPLASRPQALPGSNTQSAQHGWHAHGTHGGAGLATLQGWRASLKEMSMFKSFHRRWDQDLQLLSAGLQSMAGTPQLHTLSNSKPTSRSMSDLSQQALRSPTPFSGYAWMN